MNTLLEQGADVNAVDSYGRSVLAIAASQGHADIVRALLKQGGDVKDNTGGSPLMSAAIDGGKEIVQLLLESGADVNARTGREVTSLDDTVLMLTSLSWTRCDC